MLTDKQRGGGGLLAVGGREESSSAPPCAVNMMTLHIICKVPYILLSKANNNTNKHVQYTGFGICRMNENSPSLSRSNVYIPVHTYIQT